MKEEIWLVCCGHVVVILAEYVLATEIAVFWCECSRGNARVMDISECVLDNMARVCDLNQLIVLGLTWGVWDESIFTLKPKLILGADVLYDASAFDDLFATVTFLLQNSPGPGGMDGPILLITEAKV
uniref:Methyltransferase n=1 Tax=Salix viminalis TaxID=40686 RepID=A0A6N2LYB2_SALVM